MYPKKILYNSVLNSAFIRHNLNVKSSDQYLIKCLCTFRDIPVLEMGNKMSNLVTKIKIFCKIGKLEILSKRVQLTSKLKDQSTIIIRAWTRQCEYIVAQRFRRTQQMFCLYSRMWEERALRELLKRMQQQVARRSKEFVFGAVGISKFNWEKKKISDGEMNRHHSEFNYVNTLKTNTLVCNTCHQRRFVDIMLPDVTYCKCGNTDEYIYDNWVPFLERKQLLVWRRLHSNGNCHEYKLFGSYDDVTAEDFLYVQVDTDYRQRWDTTAVNLFVVDKDEKSNSDVIYWEMLWPRMFSNRDYVFNRRYVIDYESKIITIINKSIKHPCCPETKDKHRVNDYESCMVIRPVTTLDKPGIEFCLTYYDDPGVKIPAAVTTWVAIAGMPDFLNKLRNAAKEYRKYKQTGEKPTKDKYTSTEDEYINPPTTLPTAEEESPYSLSTSPEQVSGGYWRYIHPYYYLG